MTGVQTCALPIYAQGANLVDFGFQVSDRFVQLTAVSTPQSYNAGARAVGAATQFNYAGGANANQVWVETFNTNGQGGNHGDVDTPFYIFVY